MLFLSLCILNEECKKFSLPSDIPANIVDSGFFLCSHFAFLEVCWDLLFLLISIQNF